MPERDNKTQEENADAEETSTAESEAERNQALIYRHHFRSIGVLSVAVVESLEHR